MSKTKLKVTVKSSKKATGTPIAKVPVAIKKNARPEGEPMYKTRAQLNLHIYGANGQSRPQKSQLRRSN